MSSNNAVGVFREAVQSALKTRADLSNAGAAIEFLDSDRKLPRYVMGRNDEAKALLQRVPIDGVIDDFASGTATYNGVPLVHSDAVPPNAWVVNCSTSISPVAVERRLAGLALQQRLGISDVIAASAGRLQWPWFVRDQRQSMETRLDEWAQLYQRLADEESRQTLLDVVRFRLTADTRYMQRYTVRLDAQYFEDFMQYEREVFVDAGGFDGDTTEAFCRRYPDYRRVYLFEPSDQNMQAARRRLASQRDIHFLPLALSDREEVLNFDAAAGSASAVSDQAAGQVKACRLDDLVQDTRIQSDISFIKMDLEGWEMKALAGAAGLIERQRCKLAISVYHAAKDFLDVPQFLLGLNPHYRIHLRHYTQGWSETVMFFH